jgi:hypothetical protein
MLRLVTTIVHLKPALRGQGLNCPEDNISVRLGNSFEGKEKEGEKGYV